ncbi:hypothetical protein [Nautilia sp.]
MDINKKIEELKEIHPFILLTREPNTPGEYIFFSHIKPNRFEFVDYVFDIYIIKNQLTQDDLTALQSLLNKLLKIQYDYFEVLDMKPLKLGEFFVTYKITIKVNEQFDIEYAKGLLNEYP